jgi:transcription elongation factor Elf1
MYISNITKKFIEDHHELFAKLAKGAQSNEIKKQYWCSVCNKYIEETNIMIDNNSTSNNPVCGFCGNNLQWNYIYK